VNTDSFIVLTAAVNPRKEVPFVALTPEVRLSLYKPALKNWLSVAEQIGSKLVVVETTGEPLSSLFDVLDQEKVLFYSFAPPTEIHKLGKGALESACMDYVVNQLEVLVNADATIHKATGKLIIPNAEKIFITQNPNSITIRRSMDRSTSDTRVFSTTLKTWQKNFTSMSSETDDADPQRYLEHVLGNRIIMGEYSKQLRVQRFREIPKIEGVSGSDGTRYGGFSKDGLSNFLSYIEAKFLPHFTRRKI
jgi:hypothetical protein